MRRPSASSAVAVAALVCVAAGAQGAELRFEEAFSTPRPASVHYEARYTARDGQEQTVEAWRDGDTRVRRRTQGALEVHAVHVPGATDYDMTVLDLRRKLLTHIDRTSLFRIGNFTEWFDLAHALRHPKGAYRVARGAAPQGVEKPIAHCAWYDLEQAGRISHVCWDERSQLPLLIAGEGGRTVWRVTKLEPGAIPPEVFRYDVRDFVVNDASQDIERD